MPSLPTPELVEAIRARAGVSQEELARRLGVSFASVNAWERGRSEPRATHRAQLDELAATLGVSQGLTILVIDDDPDVGALVEAYASVLRPDGEVSVATDGHDGLLLCGTLRPDLVMLDILMPGIDGFEVADAMRRVPGLEHSTLVFVTAVRDREILERARHSHAAALISKPMARADFERCLDLAAVDQRSTG
jgi:CheY-like chemotaxis protein